MGIFVDTNNTLYCSADNRHTVVKRSLNSSTNNPIIAAGNGTCGSGSYMLCNPHGIFVDNNLTLYVAEYGQSRISRFRQGELNGTAVVGSMVSGTFSLNAPMGVVLDGDGYFFIVDQGNNRIVGSGPFGFRCLIGCSGSGSALNQLQGPRALAFDTNGNLYVSDRENDRIMKYILATNSCGMFH
jgi:DNA-binding beta-propeller fold protein YncE